MFKRFWWVFLVMALLGPIIGLMLAGVVTYVMPKKYESQAIIEIKPDSPNVESYEMTPGYVKSELGKIKSLDSLSKTVQKLQLCTKWGVDADTAIQILKNIVTTGNVRGTELFSIQVRHTDREDARNIAIQVARVFRDYKTEIRTREADKAIHDLDQLIRDQEDKVEESRKVLATIMRGRESNEITNDGAESNEESPNQDTSEDAIKRTVVVFESSDDAMKDYEADQKKLNELQLKKVGMILTERMMSELVVIHEEPQIPQSPSSPNVTLNLLLGTALGFLISPLLALPVIWILNLLIPIQKTPPLTQAN